MARRGHHGYSRGMGRQKCGVFADRRPDPLQSAYAQAQTISVEGGVMVGYAWLIDVGYLNGVVHGVRVCDSDA